MSPRPSTARAWGAPVLLGILSMVGLVTALLGDGLWDAVSWVALATPVFVCLWCIWRRTGVIS